MLILDWPIPAILSPGENGTFSSDDIGTEARHMTYLVSVVSE
jgi:hypothetical protein